MSEETDSAAFGTKGFSSEDAIFVRKMMDDWSCTKCLLQSGQCGGGNEKCKMESAKGVAGIRTKFRNNPPDPTRCF